MSKRKFYNLISGFSRFDLKRFKDFIESPFFNKSKKVIKLYNYIIKYYPTFNSNELSERNIHAKLFERTIYNSSTIRHLFTDLIKLGEKFLMQINLSQKIFESGDLLIEELSLRGLNDMLKSHLRLMEETLNQTCLAGGDYFLNKFKLETELFNFKTSKSILKNKRSSESIIKSISERNKFLVSFFIIEMTKGIDALNLLSHKFEFKTQNNFTSHFLNIFDFNKLILFMKTHPEMKGYSYIFETYYKLFQLFSNSDYEVFYFDYKETITRYRGRYSKNEIVYFSKKLIDYCILKIRTEKISSKFSEELFNVYNHIIVNDYYTNNNDKHLSVNLYRNILILALRLKKYDWIDTFLKENLKKIHPSLQKNMYRYSLAMISFEKNEYKTVLDHLLKVSLDNFDMKIDVKNMMVKVYYKLNYFEEVINTICSYKEFLRYNDNISLVRKRSHNNFLKFTRDLVKLKSSPSEISCQFISKRINDTSELVSKLWLLECIDDIKMNINSSYPAVNRFKMQS